MSFDFNEFAFSGEATEIVGPYAMAESRNGPRMAFGLKISVKEAINLPFQSDEFFVFPFGLEETCGLLPRREHELRKYLGSTLRIIAHGLGNGENFTPFDQNKVLKVTPYERRMIQIVNNDFEKTLGMEFSYKGIFERARKGWSDSLYWYSLSRASFDLRRDLLVLKQSTSNSDRSSLVERVAFHDQFVEDDPGKSIEFIRNELPAESAKKIIKSFDIWLSERFSEKLAAVKILVGNSGLKEMHSTEHERLLKSLQNMGTEHALHVVDQYRARVWNRLQHKCQTKGATERDCCIKSLNKMKSLKGLPVPAYFPNSTNKYCSEIIEKPQSLGCAGSLQWCVPF